MLKTSAYIIAKNEEKHIAACIESLRWADEIVVVDSFSSDKTVEIAKSLGCKVFQNPFENFTAQRNFALSKCSYEWVMYLDADERVSSELADEIKAHLSSEPKAYFWTAPVRYMFLNCLIRHCVFGDYPHTALYNKNKVKYEDNVLVHESLKYDGEILRLKGGIIHYSYDSIDQYLQKTDLYTSLGARQKYEKGESASFINLFLVPHLAFFRMYILRKAFLDGLGGLIFCLLYAYVYKIIEFAKMWEIQKKK